jgi:thymidine phosphorylase
VGPSAKIRTADAAASICELFRAVAPRIGLVVETIVTEARAPVGFGIGPRLEAIDALAVLRGRPEAPVDLREKSLYLAARALELVGAVRGGGYRAAQQALDSGDAARCFDRIAEAQGPRTLPPAAPCLHVVCAPSDGRIRAIDCWRVGRVAKRAGAPVHPAAGVRLLRGVGDVVRRGEPLYEIHAQSDAQLEAARSYAEGHPEIHGFGF